MKSMLALVLLTLGSQAAAQEEGSCPLDFYEPGLERRVPAPDSESCASLLSFLPAYKALMKAADFSEGDIPLVGVVDKSVNAHYYHSYRKISVNTETMRRHPGPDDAILFVLAHEVGHAVQGRGGELGWEKSAWNGPTEEWMARSRIIEAQADQVAADLLRRTGLGGRKTALSGVEGFFKCDSITAEGQSPSTHPASEDRFLNQLKGATLSGEAMSALGGLGAAGAGAQAGAFDGSRPAAGDEAVLRDAVAAPPYRPALGLDAFDAWGRLKTEGLRTRPVPEVRPAPLAPASAGEHAQSLQKGLWADLRSSLDAALGTLADIYWFNNPLVEKAALRSCGLPKEADFNDAVKVGAMAWAASTAADMTNTLRSWVGGGA